MKLVLISAITASVFLTASSLPTFAQSTPAEAADQAAALAAGADPTGAIVVRKRARVIVPDNAAVVTAPAVVMTAPAVAATRPFDSAIATHAASNGIPVELVHRVVVRESRYRANVMGRGGATGLMQIKLATARGMGYTGSAAGLLDPETNLTYGVKYLAGAYRAAGGHHGRAVGYYASGYYHAAKRQRAPADAYAKATAEPAIFTTAGSGEPVVVMPREVRRKRR